MQGYDWDDKVQDQIANKIKDWFKQLESLKEVKIPQSLQNPEPVKSKSIVTFVDTSQQAYGEAVYIRCKYNNAITSCLIAAKNKVAPLSTVQPKNNACARSGARSSCACQNEKRDNCLTRNVIS